MGLTVRIAREASRDGTTDRRNLLGPRDLSARDGQPRRRGETWFPEHDLTRI